VVAVHAVGSTTCVSSHSELEGPSSRSVVRNFRFGVSPCGSDDSAEPVVFVSDVFNYPGGSIGLNQAVRALHHVAIPRLPLVLDVSGVGIVNGVVELVLRRRLFNTRTASVSKTDYRDRERITRYRS
jgi:hypothetical protein